MLTPLIKEILAFPVEFQDLMIRGWVRTKRELKNQIFLEVNDGSSFRSIQCIFDRGGDENTRLSSAMEAALEAVSTGSSVTIRGRFVPSPTSGQAVEVATHDIELIWEAPAETYPLQKERHSLEFLREIAHLRARTNTFAAVARIRNSSAFGVHQLFQDRSFQYVHTPIITANDAEVAGAMFQVTAFDMDILAQSGKAPDYSRNFFGKRSYLTVSGHLEAETYTTALSRVYTFGPTFRAENSNTTRHLAEFWMVEPETAFAELEDNMLLAEEFLKFLFTIVLRDCADDIAFFNAHIEKGIAAALQSVIESRFTHITYTDAVMELEKYATAFEFKPSWGCDLQSEHEKFLTEVITQGPMIITDYPKAIKAFYIKLNKDEKRSGLWMCWFPVQGRSSAAPAPNGRKTALALKTDSLNWVCALKITDGTWTSAVTVRFPMRVSAWVLNGSFSTLRVWRTSGM